MEDLIKYVEEKYTKKQIPNFSVGDTVKVYIKFQEGDRVRTQVFEGIVIARRGSGTRETFTVRKISYGEGVERVFPLQSPSIEKIEVIKRGDVRRAKLYYLRERVGKKATKVKEKIFVKEESENREETD
jgi:large subunit ribosomal protein L19